MQHLSYYSLYINIMMFKLVFLMRNEINLNSFMMIFSFLCESLLSDSNSILKNAYRQGIIEFSVSGSSSQWINGSLQKTKPEYAFDQLDKSYDWCSNCERSKDEHPYLILSVKNQVMHVSGYYLRAGCCKDNECCCQDVSTNYCCECCLYSWSIQISDNNQTWKTIHNVEKDLDMCRCKEMTYSTIY